MQKTVRAMFAPSFLVVAFAALGKLYAADATVIYHDDFSTVAGYQEINTDGELTEIGVPEPRTVHVFVSDSTFGGTIAMSATEDNKTMGFDEKPGVLVLASAKVPTSADYSGFVFAGSEAKPIQLPTLGATATEADLKRIKVSFRYKAVNADEKRLGATYNCRFERSFGDSYEQRIHFGELNATGKWKTFEKTLSDGENTSEFLIGVNASTERLFQFVWGRKVKCPTTILATHC